MPTTSGVPPPEAPTAHLNTPYNTLKLPEALTDPTEVVSFYIPPLLSGPVSRAIGVGVSSSARKTKAVCNRASGSNSATTSSGATLTAPERLRNETTPTEG